MDLEKLVKDLENRLIEARQAVLRQEGALLLAHRLLAEHEAEAKAKADKAQAEEKAAE